jgi:ribosomal protein L11 methyltransferase
VAVELPPYEFATPGPLRERLAGLVLAEVKTATFTLAVLDEMWPEGMLPPGSLAHVVSSAGARLATIEVLSRRTLSMGAVTFDLVAAEGEGDGSVGEWRAGHEEYWRQFIDAIRAHTGDPGWELTDATDVVYETFRVAERLPAADEGRYAVVELVVPPEDLEVAVSELDDLGTIGVEELRPADLTSPARSAAIAVPLVGLRAGFASERIAATAERTLPRRWLPRLEVIVGDEWLDTWRESFEPVRSGRVVVAPAWHDRAELSRHPMISGAAAHDLVIWLDPGRSFGTGAHPSTSLALAALQAVGPGAARVLDVGCGSGVLGIAAAMLGAAWVECVDVEPAALRATNENAVRNGVADRCRAVESDLGVVAGRFDVVVANILAPTLIELAGQPGGRVVLAGLVGEQRDRVIAAFPGFDVVSEERSGPWVALVLRSPGTTQAPRPTRGWSEAC